MNSKTSALARPAAFTRGLLCCAGLGLGALVGTSCRPPLAACADDAREDDDTREQALALPPLSHIFNHGPLSSKARWPVRGMRTGCTPMGTAATRPG